MSCSNTILEYSHKFIDPESSGSNFFISTLISSVVKSSCRSINIRTLRLAGPTASSISR